LASIAGRSKLIQRLAMALLSMFVSTFGDLGVYFGSLLASTTRG